MSNGPLSGRPLPSSFDGNDDFYNESGFQKILRRLKEEPLVPIGALLTVAAFTNAYRASRTGDHHKVQRMFRARVAAQAFTVAAMVAGGWYYQEDRHKKKELWKLQQQQEAEEKRQKWIKELEARDAEDKALKEMLEKRRKRAAERAGGTGSEAIAIQARAAMKDSKHDFAKSETDGVENTENDAKNQEGGVLGSLGGWFGGGSKQAPQDSVQTQDIHSDDSKK
ncbi:hypoxia induced protein conserved region-domain-containing protein [Podospora australis]|uniref:Hypoxia induced protein conserved region-domain-containing protein n=1 Tax=Podospora australis TaxID=1536484 RepID=A0AAN6WV21_9PEZI|nr:hypoxia induced protein conserved region-domain-containing protein [Podospora australis]